ncbi:hypothetical protein AOQ84DRAFT_373885 [Glonium stellatum]|uniref:Ribosomal protein s17 n=1 Tax=Glonium stellatum TaxID=574774 RepID=A0A8E2JVS3_9PEZI|nr:hypothetical protein AOQ84DRAFT_373885 [Glonium stellatum]
MRFTETLSVLALAVGLANAAGNGFKGQGQGQGQKGNGGNAQTSAASATAATASGAAGGNGGNAGNNAADLALNPANVQSNSDTTGLSGTVEAGQAASATDPANFINFCTGKTLTNGLQVTGGSCNGIVMGDIPSSSQMISATMINPKDGDVVEQNSNITFQVQLENLVAGSFTNPDVTYYAAPQALSGGKIVGHTHITVQSLGQNFFPTSPPDPAVFSFFKGINDAGNGNGLLSATLAGGLPIGFYRVCSMTSASNHQPVLMPVAQRGAQDDCARFQVAAQASGNLIECALNPSGQGCAANAAGGNANGGNANGGNANNANGASSAAAVAQTSAAAAQSTGAAGGKTGQNGQAGKGGKFGAGKQGQRFGRPRKFSAREFVA